MASVHIDLQEGFTGESVIVRIDGREVYRQDEVRTRFQIGHADSCQLDVEDGTVEMETIVADGNPASRSLELSGPTYVGISLTADGAVDYKVATEPFRYA